MNTPQRHRPRSLDPQRIPEQGMYKIGTLAAIVGLTPNLLRAWERRYEMFRRNRDSGKQRLYTQEDVRLFQRVKEMLNLGLSISEVAGLGRENLLAQPRETGHATPPLARLTPLSEGLRAQLLALAPELSWPGEPRRYRGEGLGVSVRSLNPSDLATVHRLYTLVKGLYELWNYMEQQPVADMVARRLQQLQDPQFLASLAQLGAATLSADPLVQGALEDARLGALTLLARPSIWDSSTAGPGLGISLARDHAKMLRNAFVDLDPSLREADEHPRAHDLGPVLAKLVHLKGTGWVDQVGTDYHGFISSRCLETSALDRLCYRCLHLLGAPAGVACNLWVVQTSSDLLRWVFEVKAPLMQPVFREECMSTRIVSLAVGVSPRQALAQGYLGSSLDGNIGRAWFHWPAYDPPPGEARCSCHPLSDEE